MFQIYKISNNHIEKFTKILGNKTYTLREAYKTLPNFKALVDSDKYFLDKVLTYKSMCKNERFNEKGFYYS